jgi:hypothetical protein
VSKVASSPLYMRVGEDNREIRVGDVPLAVTFPGFVSNVVACLRAVADEIERNGARLGSLS